jgi:hypothetical protein
MGQSTSVSEAGIAQSVQRLSMGCTAKVSEIESQQGQDSSPLHVV